MQSYFGCRHTTTICISFFNPNAVWHLTLRLGLPREGPSPGPAELPRFARCAFVCDVRAASPPDGVWGVSSLLRLSQGYGGREAHLRTRACG